MKTSPVVSVLIVILLLIIAGGFYFALAPKVNAPVTMATTSPSAAATNATYMCTTGSIMAVYGNNSVALTLSDGRSFVLPQVQSGSGIRYEQGEGSAQDIVFSSEGANAFLTENGKMTYENCVAGAPTTTGTGGSGTTGGGGTTTGMKSFTDQGKTFSFMYPPAFTLSGGGVGYTQNWMQNATTQGILFVKVTVPSSFEPKTNFVDATFTVGTSAADAAVASCLTAPQSGGSATQKSTVTINGTQYTKFVSNDAGAGNFYETTSYRTVRNKQCYAVEYTIHSSNIANYSPDQGITAFDHAKIENALEGIVQSFKFL